MKKIITALASYGMSGEVFHAPLINFCEGLELKYIVQRSKNTAIDKYPLVTILKNFDEILALPEIELVVINTPNQLHFQMAKDCLNAGKHVVVEKPFTVNREEAEYLIALAKEKNLILSVFHNKRLENDFLIIEEILRENLLGEIVDLELHYDRFRTHITAKKWKEDDLPGAGTLYDLGVHLIDMVLQLFGSPMAVTADLRILRKEAFTYDYFNVRLDYPNTRVILRSSTLVREPVPSIQLHGYKGSFVKYGTDPQETQLKEGILPSDENYGIENPLWNGILHTVNELNEPVREKLQSPQGQYPKYYDNLYWAITENRNLLVKPEEALEAIKIIELAMKSFDEKRTIFI